MTVRTASLWGTPPSRYYQLLRRVEADKRERLAVAIVGCSDGKFVLPAARRGHSECLSKPWHGGCWVDGHYGSPTASRRSLGHRRTAPPRRAAQAQGWPPPRIRPGLFDRHHLRP